LDSPLPPTDESIMTNIKTGVRLIIDIYGDDLLMTGENEGEIEKVVDKLKQTVLKVVI
jgi:hypothetical protein